MSQGSNIINWNRKQLLGLSISCTSFKSLCGVYVADCCIYLENQPSSALWPGQIAAWFWSAVCVSVKPGKTESSFVFFIWVQSWLFVELFLWRKLKSQNSGKIGSIQALRLGKTMVLGAVIYLSDSITLPSAGAIFPVLTEPNHSIHFFIVHCSVVAILSKNVFVKCLILFK